MRAIGYVRVSTNEQAASGLGLEGQRAAIVATAARLGAELVAVHEDAGLSGSLAVESRPGLLGAVGELRRGDVLLVAKRDRLGRDVVVCALLERLVAKRGAKIVSAAGEGSDDAGPSGELMRTLVDAFGQYERALIATRTKLALAAKRARGERAGNVPFGFAAKSDGRLVEDPREQAVIALVRELRAEGATVRGIVEALEARGVTGRTGRPLGLSQVHAVLKAAA